MTKLMKGEIRKDKHKPLKVSCTEEGEATYSQQTVRSHPCAIACPHFKKKKKKIRVLKQSWIVTLQK